MVKPRNRRPPPPPPLTPDRLLIQQQLADLQRMLRDRLNSYGESS